MRNALVLLVLAAAAIATSVPETVYITKTGEKYHQSGCRMLRKSKIAIEKSQATARGFAACKICH